MERSFDTLALSLILILAVLTGTGLARTVATVSMEDARARAEERAPRLRTVVDITNPGVVYERLREGVDAWRASLGVSCDEWGNTTGGCYVSAARPDAVPASLMSFLCSFYADSPTLALAMGPEGVVEVQALLEADRESVVGELSGDYYDEGLTEVADEPVADEPVADEDTGAGAAAQAEPRPADSYGDPWCNDGISSDTVVFDSDVVYGDEAPAAATESVPLLGAVDRSDDEERDEPAPTGRIESGAKGADAAVRWAVEDAVKTVNPNNGEVGESAWHGWCLGMVARAWSIGAGRYQPLLSGGDARASMNKFRGAGKLRPVRGSIPEGSPVFWDYGTWGHVAIATGRTDDNGEPLIASTWVGGSLEGIFVRPLSFFTNYVGTCAGWGECE